MVPGRWSRFFLVVSLATIMLASPLAAQQGPSSDRLARAVDLFREFVADLSEHELESGSCVQHSQWFCQRLRQGGLDSDGLRIVLMVREPAKGYMPQPMVPDKAWVRGQPVNFWIWHSFVVLDGVAFDPKYRNLTDPLGTYHENMWARAPEASAFWVFSVRPEGVSEIAGSTYPGGPPRMISFAPITPRELVARPDHLTSRKDAGSGTRRSATAPASLVRPPHAASPAATGVSGALPADAR